MKKYYLVVLILCLGLLQAQETKFGKVTVEELQQTECPIDKEAEAAILFQDIRISYPTNYINFEKEVYVKIKVYDKDKARKFLEHTEYLRKYNNSEEYISGFKGVTYNLENGKVEETKIEKDQIFKTEVSKSRDSYAFTFPNVKNGSILEYKYTVYSEYHWEIPTVYFQFSIPVIYETFSYDYPEFKNYNEDLRGDIQPKNHYTDGRKWDANYSSTTKNLVYENVPARKNEAFVINSDNLKPSVRYELSGYTIPGRVYENYAMTWDAVFKAYDESEDFGKQLKQENFFKEIVEPIIANAKTNDEKAAMILNYVQKNIVWNNYSGEYTETSVKKAFKDKKGNCGDLNLMLINMLKAAGLDAYPVLISTVDNGVINPAYPSRNKFNYVLASYIENNAIRLLDGTSKHSNINQLPKRCLSDKGYLVKGKAYQVIPIINEVSSRSASNISVEFEGNTVKGNFKEIVNNYYALEKVEEYYSDKEEFKKGIMDKHNFKIENAAFEMDENKFITKYDFTYSDNIEVIGNKILFNPLLFLATDEQIFNAPTRTYNLEFGTPFSNTSKVRIKIPEGYKVETLPEIKAYKIPNDAGDYAIRYSEKDGYLDVFTQLNINSAILTANYYEPLKLLWQSIIDNETQYISLIKE